MLSLCREALADGEEHLAFYLATLIDHEKLIRRLGWTAVDNTWHDAEPCPARWTEGLVRCHPHRLRESLAFPHANFADTITLFSGKGSKTTCFTNAREAARRRLQLVRLPHSMQIRDARTCHKPCYLRRYARLSMLKVGGSAIS